MGGGSNSVPKKQILKNESCLEALTPPRRGLEDDRRIQISFVRNLYQNESEALYEALNRLLDGAVILMIV